MEYVQGQGVRALVAVSGTKRTGHYSDRGLKFIIERLKPLCIVVYGGVPDDIFSCCTDAGIKILHFPGGFHATKRAVSA